MLKIIVLLGLMASCKPSDPPKPTEEKEVPPQALVWKMAADSNNLKLDGGHPIIYNNHLIVGIELKSGYVIRSYDLETNEIAWENDDMPSSNFWPQRADEIHLKDNLMIMSSGHRILTIDMNNGHEIWRHVLNEGNYESALIGNRFYKSDEIHKQTSTMFRFDIHTGAKEELFTVSKGDYNTETYSPRLRMPVKWTHPSGDEILVLQNRTFNWDGVGQQDPADASRMDILGYNLTADTMLWYRRGLAKISSTATPVISGDKVYFYGGDKVHCIHPATGEDIWEFQVHGANALEFVSSNILLYEDMLIAKPDSRAMYALDKETGRQIWYNPNTMSSPSAMTIERDTVYFTGYYVNGVDVHTGELIFQYTSPENRSFYNGVGINPENGLIYASDGAYLYCLDPKYMK